MALMEWNDSLSIGLDEIDSQHKKLVGYINDLHEGMLSGKSKEVLSGILQGLVSYTQEHFGNEERYFKEFDYIDKDAHEKEHQMFVAKIKKFKEDYESGNGTVSLNLMDFLKDWLTHHIQGTDTKYVQLFKEKGIK